MGNAKQLLRELIEKRIANKTSIPKIDQQIWDIFGETWCVVFTDMAGFSKKAKSDGIIPFLVLIHEMQNLVQPIVTEHAGMVLKNIADSQVILFRDPVLALRACVSIQQACYELNKHRKESEKIYLGCGLGYGDVIKVGDEDIFGVEVNLAAKLGEDIADAYEILLTPNTRTAIGKQDGITYTKITGKKSGRVVSAYFRAKFELDPTEPPLT